MKDHWASEVLHRVSKSDLSVPSDLQRDIVRLCVIVQGLPYYEFRNLELADLTDALLDCADVYSLAETMVEVGKICGFDHANIFLLRHGNAITFSKRVCTSFPEEWLLTYDARRYQFLDPVVVRAIHGGAPFLFSELPNNAPIVKEFWNEANAYGVGSEGCCFVFDLEPGIRIGMSFTGTVSRETAARAFEVNYHDLQILGEVACRVFVELCGTVRIDGTQLSIDELRYLKKLINTKDPANLSNLLQDSNTQSLQRSICNQLGVGTVFQALAVVVREGWFDDLPFDSQEIAMPSSKPIKRTSGRLFGHMPWELDVAQSNKDHLAYLDIDRRLAGRSHSMAEAGPDDLTDSDPLVMGKKHKAKLEE